MCRASVWVKVLKVICENHLQRLCKLHISVYSFFVPSENSFCRGTDISLWVLNCKRVLTVMKIWKQENDLSNFPKKKQVLNIFVFNLNGKKMTLHQEVELILPVEKIKDSWLISQKLPSLINNGIE